MHTNIFAITVCRYTVKILWTIHITCISMNRQTLKYLLKHTSQLKRNNSTSSPNIKTYHLQYFIPVKHIYLFIIWVLRKEILRTTMSVYLKLIHSRNIGNQVAEILIYSLLIFYTFLMLILLVKQCFMIFK